MDISTAISVLGGVGLFLLGMSVMTNGLKALAGSGLRATLSKAASTPLSGTFWGAFVTLIVQSSSATTMTTIGLVSAGLLTFSQGLGLVFGANIGTTGTAWLIALVGVRISLTAYALPMIFVGALIMLLGRGRVSAAGGALAGFALVLFGLTTLQQGMSGVAEQLHPSNLPAVFGPGVSWWSALLSTLILIVVGLAMTAVMQSSTAAVAVTLSAQYAGAVGVDQACALIIGQNIGTATSSALAAIGASRTAQRLALAYILFKLIAAVIALVLFPLTVPPLVRLSSTIEGVTLLAGYHTAFNVVGVAVMLPMINRFSQFVERILPESGSPLTRTLDPAALLMPIAAEEAVRRTVARSLQAICASINAALTDRKPVSVTAAGDALRQARQFISDADGPPESENEQERLTRTLHALDHASRLADVAGETHNAAPVSIGSEDVRAAELCADAMRHAVVIGDDVGALPDTPVHAAEALEGGATEPPTAHAIERLAYCAEALDELQRVHRKATLSSVAGGAMSADEAIARVDAVRRLESLAHHAWRSAMYLLPPK
ncbi:MAG TPA: Na/Pi symporter [Candidatus Aquilonibacter sp.]